MVNIKISNRVLYTFIAVLILIVVIGIGYAYTNPTTGVGHGADEIGPGTMEGPITIKGQLKLESQSFESGGVPGIRLGQITENGKNICKSDGTDCPSLNCEIKTYSHSGTPGVFAIQKTCNTLCSEIGKACVFGVWDCQTQDPRFGDENWVTGYNCGNSGRNCHSYKVTCSCCTLG
jgi:hypothetical protein